MKRFIQFFSFIALALVFSAVSAQAQSTTKVEAEIPFDFNVGDTKFSAGTYEIRLVGSGSGTARLVLDGGDKGDVYSTVILRDGTPAGEQAKLVFAVSGDTRTLLTIKTNDAGFTVPATRKVRSATIRASVSLKKAPERS
ncbi:MAG: hypothetical protein QUS14_02220 [Pyrinomonadaceae bacterium]|nr:hypothetical protein [Pyrinomonadaceae bacterium]